jgi:hypothetical protein
MAVFAVASVDQFELQPGLQYEHLLDYGASREYLLPITLLPDHGYEVRVSYIGSYPVTLTVELLSADSDLDTTRGGHTDRQLLDVEKAMFTTDARGQGGPVGAVVSALLLGKLNAAGKEAVLSRQVPYVITLEPLTLYVIPSGVWYMLPLVALLLGLLYMLLGGSHSDKAVVVGDKRTL